MVQGVHHGIDNCLGIPVMAVRHKVNPGWVFEFGQLFWYSLFADGFKIPTPHQDNSAGVTYDPH
ncbi:MAG: hypothetical protein FWG15_02255 [Propionibacteriaceae bacterium]|nr:hypothetical protein [Propionibacteriaceae bacterium]